MPLSKRTKVILLVVPPAIAVLAILVAAWADNTERKRLDAEYDACITACTDRVERSRAAGKPIPDDALVRCFEEPDFVAHPGLKYLPELYCKRGVSSDYDGHGLIAASAIGILWGPWALWLLVLAMIRSVIITVRRANDDAKK